MENKFCQEDRKRIKEGITAKYRKVAGSPEGTLAEKWNFGGTLHYLMRELAFLSAS